MVLLEKMIKIKAFEKQKITYGNKKNVMKFTIN